MGIAKSTSNVVMAAKSTAMVALTELTASMAVVAVVETASTADAKVLQLTQSQNFGTTTFTSKEDLEWMCQEKE